MSVELLVSWGCRGHDCVGLMCVCVRACVWGGGSFSFGCVWVGSENGAIYGGGGLVAEETCPEKFSTPNSGAIFPITFNDCGAIFPILFLDIKFKICTLCGVVGGALFAMGPPHQGGPYQSVTGPHTP